MTTVRDALVQLKALLMTATAAGQPALVAGYVMPDDYALLPNTLALPSLVVGELYNVPNDALRKASGLALDRWRAEILLFTAAGPLTTLNAESAAAMLTTRGWARALSDVLWANQTLNRTAQIVGEPAGEMRRLMQYAIGHIYLSDTGEYWGLRAEVVIQQTHAQAMTA